MSQNKTIDGGPAFPGTTHGAEGHTVSCPEFGMSLRDFFAAKAMPTAKKMVGNATVGKLGREFNLGRDFEDQDWPQAIAIYSYKIADAMLAARK